VDVKERILEFVAVGQLRAGPQHSSTSRLNGSTFLLDELVSWVVSVTKWLTKW